MKLTAFILIISLMQVTAATFGQTVTLKQSNVSIAKLFYEIRKQTGYDVIVENTKFKMDKRIDANFSNTPLSQVLNQIFTGTNLAYTIEDKTVLIKEPSLAPLKTIDVVGRVTDEKGDILVRATVIVKGTKTVTYTDDKGIFKLKNVDDNAILLITYIGYQVKEVKAAESLNIVLRPANNDMKEVVVNGYFERNKEQFTGAAKAYTRTELLKVGNVNIIQSLKNLDPSFNMLQNLTVGSDPNALPNINIRGQASLPNLKGDYQGDPNMPLFILDGFEATLTQIIDLDMNLVASVTILKDASAKAVYGSKAANGVVVIETLKPIGGKLRLTYSASSSISLPDFSSYNLTNAREKLEVEKMAGLYTAKATLPNLPSGQNQLALDQKYQERLAEVLSGTNTDWLAQPVRTGISTNQSLGISGGNDPMIYGVNVAYNNEAGVMKGSNRKTFSGSVQFRYRIKNISINNQLLFSSTKSNNSPYGSFSAFSEMNPYYRPTDENGRITKMAGRNILATSAEASIGNDLIPNPLWNGTINTKDFGTSASLRNNFDLEWRPSQSFSIKGRLTIEGSTSHNELFLPASHTTFIATGAAGSEVLLNRGRYTYGSGGGKNLGADINAYYNKAFGLHSFSVSGGWTVNSRNSNGLSVTAQGFPNDFLDDISFARQYLQNTRPSGSESTTRDQSALGTFSYSYADNRYVLDGVLRMTASSQFGANSRWGKFWSTGVRWNVNKESFAKNWKTIVDLRSSIGYTGAQNFSSYQSRSSFTYTALNTYLGGFGAGLMGHGNPDLQWQRQFDKDLGVDAIFFDGWLSLTADCYSKVTRGGITDVAVPISTGFTTYKANGGEIENRGWELSFRSKIWNGDKGRNSLSIFGSVVHNKGVVTDIGTALTYANASKTNAKNINASPYTRYTNGQSMTAIWAVPSYGIDPASGREIYIMPDGQITHVWNTDYLAVVGDSEAKLRGNLGVSLNYNGFSMTLSSNWRYGGQLYNSTLVSKVENVDLTKNVDRRIYTDRWRKPGDLVLFKDITDDVPTNATQRFVEDDNQIMLTSLNLQYDLKRLMKSRKITSLRVSVTVNDVAQLSSVRLERGTAYPFARRFSFTISPTF